jgi:hypothetical protein
MLSFVLYVSKPLIFVNALNCPNFVDRETELLKENPLRNFPLSKLR